MDFRTKIPLKPKQPKINYQSKMLSIGSCFVENMGRKFDFYQFRQLQNPFGILFHPAAILQFLQRVEQLEKTSSGTKNIFTETDVFFHQERWHCFEAHSSLNAVTGEEILDRLNEAVRESLSFIKEASHVILTLGTAWAYRNLETEKTVANCHKLPQQQFKKELLGVKADLYACLTILHNLNPNLQIIFTVSPVRHLKDGFVENQRSKALLISAIHDILEDSNLTSRDKLHYFPSYELMMDELRDYRFYAEDMLHPNQTAIDYIWKRFQETWMASEAILLMAEVEKIQKSRQHLPFNAESTSYQNFLHKLQERVKKLREKIPHLSF